MDKEVDKIIDKLNNSNEVITMNELRDKLNKNEKYLNLMSEYENNKDKYISENKIIDLRKELFEIDELKEYLKIQNKLRLLSIQINNIIISILD